MVFQPDQVLDKAARLFVHELLRPASLELRVSSTFAALGNFQRGSVNHRRAWLRMSRACQGGHERGVAAQGPAMARRAIHDEVEPATVFCSDAGGGGVGEQLLRDDLAFRPHRLSRDADPRPFHQLSPPGQQAGARASKRVVAKTVDYCTAPRIRSARGSVQWQGLPEPASQRDLHRGRWQGGGRLCRDRREPGARLWPGLGAQERLGTRRHVWQ